MFVKLLAKSYKWQGVGGGLPSLLWWWWWYGRVNEERSVCWRRRSLGADLIPFPCHYWLLPKLDSKGSGWIPYQLLGTASCVSWSSGNFYSTYKYLKSLSWWYVKCTNIPFSPGRVDWESVYDPVTSAVARLFMRTHSYKLFMGT